MISLQLYLQPLGLPLRIKLLLKNSNVHALDRTVMFINLDDPAINVLQPRMAITAANI